MKKTLVFILLATTTLTHSCSSKSTDLNNAIESLNKMDRKSHLDNVVIESQFNKMDSLTEVLNNSNSDKSNLDKDVVNDTIPSDQLDFIDSIEFDLYIKPLLEKEIKAYNN